VAVRWWRRPLVRVASLLALGLAVLSLGPRLHVAGRITRVHLPRRAVEVVPVVNDLLPNRLMLYVFLLAGLLVATFADAVIGQWERRRAALGIAALVLALAPLLPRWPAPSTRLAAPPFFAQVVDRIPQGSVALVAPLAVAGGATFAAVADAAATVLVAWALAEWLYSRGVSVRA
jgi:hypothetical protein